MRGSSTLSWMRFMSATSDRGGFFLAQALGDERRELAGHREFRAGPEFALAGVLPVNVQDVVLGFEGLAVANPVRGHEIEFFARQFVLRMLGELFRFRGEADDEEVRETRARLGENVGIAG